MSLVCGLTKRMALHNTNLCQTIHVHLEMKCEENQLLCPTWFSKHWKKALYNTVYSIYIYIYILVTWPRIARNHQIYAFQLFTTSSASSSATPWFCNWGKVPLKSYWQLFTSPAVSKIKDVERYHHQEIRKDTTGSSDWRISWHGFLQQSNCASRGMNLVASLGSKRDKKRRKRRNPANLNKQQSQFAIQNSPVFWDIEGKYMKIL